MTTPDEQRIVRYTLQLGIDPLEEAQQSIGDAIAKSQRDATEVTRLEAARRQRIESDSIREIAALQAEMLAERQRLERQTISGLASSDFERPKGQVDPESTRDPAPENAAKRDYAALADASRPTVAPEQPRQEDSPPGDKAPVAATPPLQVEAKAKREYVVHVEEDVDQLVERIAQQIEMQLDAREQGILEQVKRRLADFAANRGSSFRGA
ncbi:hypothetical protein LOC68_09880 [Blastopirellula sp. JC732]|uniref:Uncharacterized protein n=1 Tax=Blastopirellula sediminis TaxID=2894196 RepID=A0A9X1SG81_9BACT|nr:hypothetical protein [Blastopirellula sediminis]MCC9608516.1 hypothetical protein [Blastopirellula sediminis]MCC9628707.1 hypothetical protein [Blastopirellula sediminis]